MMNFLISIKDRLARRWADGGLKVRIVMGGAVVCVVFVIGLAAMAIFGGGGGGGGPVDVEGVQVGEDGVMVFDDEAGSGSSAGSASGGGATAVAAAAPADGAPAAGASSGAGFPNDSAVADAVAATIAALVPTAEPTRPADYLATLQAGIGRSRSEYPSVALNPLDPAGGRERGLNESEIQLFQSFGEYFWDILQAWVVVRSILEVRDLHEWDYSWLQEELDLVSWLMPESGTMSQDVWDRPDVGELVQAYLVEVREAEYAFRDTVTSLNAALGVFERAGVYRYDELDGEDADEVWQHFVDAERGAYEVGSIMSLYGCSICGELYRASGVPSRRE